MIPILPAQHAIKYTPQTVQIYQYDASPIGDRHPLLLVHGLKDEYVRRLHWGKVCKYLRADPAFARKYKIYLARYNSLAPEKQTEESFKPAIRNLAAEQKQPVFVVALSIAGDIVRGAMNDPDVDKSVSKVITMGSPFHGSPLFNKDWMFYSSFKHHKWIVCKLDRYLAYSVYFKFHKNLLADYYWDDYDNQIPDVGNYKFRLPFVVEGKLVPPTEKPSGANCAGNGSKFIAYAGYFQDRYIEKMERSRLFLVLHAPVSFFYTTVPAHLGNGHAALRLLNYEIAFIDQKHPGQFPTYTYNDGVAPIASALSLSPSEEPAHVLSNNNDGGSSNDNDGSKAAPAALDPPAESDLAKKPPALKLKSSVNRARLFPNIDHITFLDGYRPIGGHKNVIDQLSPDEKPRTIFEWLLDDIMN